MNPPGGSGIKNLPADAGFGPWSGKTPHAKEQLSLRAPTTEPVLGACVPQLLKPACPAACASQRQKSPQWEACTQQLERAALLAWWSRICLQRRRSGCDPWVGKIPWRRKWQPTPVFLPRENPLDRGAWQATVHRVTRVGHNLATTPPPPPPARWILRKSLCSNKDQALPKIKLLFLKKSLEEISRWIG